MSEFPKQRQPFVNYALRFTDDESFDAVQAMAMERVTDDLDLCDRLNVGYATVAVSALPVLKMNSLSTVEQIAQDLRRYADSTPEVAERLAVEEAVFGMGIVEQRIDRGRVAAEVALRLESLHEYAESIPVELHGFEFPAR